MLPDQDAVFLRSEGDRWFERNKAALASYDPAGDLVFRLLELYGLVPASVLEIGASNGARVDAIRRRLGCRAAAADPSAAALRDGKKRFPKVRFVRGTLAEVPLREVFDLVIVNFVFHWVDRRLLLRSAAEADRLTADGGFLLIGDFLPSNRFKVKYHHLPDQDVHTYKQDYAALFLASGLYRPVGLLTRGHAGKALAAGVAEEERAGAWLLEKRIGAGYAESTRA